MTTYHGSCYCGAVRFTAEGDLSAGTSRCNCSFCRKMRYWEMPLPDPAGLHVLSGAEALAETPLRPAADGAEPMDLHHVFCARCGTRLWTTGTIPELGGAVAMVSVAALDDVPVKALVAAPVRTMNGAADDWFNPAPEARHL